MRPSLLTLAAAATLAAPAAAAAAPTTPEGWQAATAQDLTAIHDILRDNSPAMVVKRDSAHFRSWLDEGLRQARSKLPQVRDAKGYYYVVRYYVAGFRDSHIQFGPNRQSGVNLSGYAWPGFMLGYRNGGYEVAFRASDASDAPPPGARLLGCDGKGAEALVQAHDLYDGDFRLASVRAARAVDLMMERGNPFISHPNVCRFRIGGETKTYRLGWRPLDDAHTRELDAALFSGPRRKLGIEPWTDGRWWIQIPSMNGGQDWSGFYADVTVPA
jgi:hypothetical protein